MTPTGDSAGGGEGTPRPFLASEEDLERLFRGFVSGVWLRAASASNPEHPMTGPEAAQADQKEARRLIAILSGRDPGWDPAPGWTPGHETAWSAGLELHLRYKMAGTCSPKLLQRPGGPVEALLVYGLSETYRQIGTIAQKSEEDLRYDVDNTIEELVNMAIGRALDWDDPETGDPTVRALLAGRPR